MARPLVLRFQGAEIPVTPESVDRSALYGSVEVQALDERGRRCELATLAGDGRTLIARGGSTFGVLSQEGEWLDRSRLKPVDADGKPLAAVPSSYAAPVPVERRATIDEYLSHNIKSVYVIAADAAALGALGAELAAGAIYTFPYSFRGGFEPDQAFLLAGADGAIFLLVGEPTRWRFVGLEAAAAAGEPDAEEEAAEDESLDFGMM